MNVPDDFPAKLKLVQACDDLRTHVLNSN